MRWQVVHTVIIKIDVLCVAIVRQGEGVLVYILPPRSVNVKNANVKEQNNE